MAGDDTAPCVEAAHAASLSGVAVGVAVGVEAVNAAPDVTPSESLPIVLDFVAGSVSGAMSVAVGQPFDTVKVRLQTDGSYRGALDCVSQLVRKEGAASLFRGVLSPVATMSVINAIIFSAHGEYIRHATDKGRRAATSRDQFFGGCLGGLIQTAVLTPTDVVKCRMQANRKYRHSMDVVRSTLRTSGMAGLYKGHTLTMIREVPAFGAYFLVYDHVKDLLRKHVSQWPASFLAGGVSGSLTWALVYPVDVVKSIVQTAPIGTDSRMATVARDLYSRHGLGFFFRGFWTACARAFPVNAVLFPAYEVTLRLLRGVPLMKPAEARKVV